MRKSDDYAGYDFVGNAQWAFRGRAMRAPTKIINVKKRIFQNEIYASLLYKF